MEKLKGKCHCGTVEFEVNSTAGVQGLMRCDCSLCRRKGAIMATAPVTDLSVTKGEDQLSVYQWNTKIAKHYFCSRCGIYTHHQRRKNPQEYGFNIACIEGLNPADLGEVAMTDGRASSLVGK